ncbi:MAG: PHP domain-containing protein, partial [Hyphomicrobiales bacterium]|nr:PHP domain-containing protein [Hyphomicrobiales bacterium]
MAEGLAEQPFVHLRVHSAYSLLEGALRIEQLSELAGRQNMPALALTDSNNLFGALEFSQAMAQKGIQPIVGCTLTVELRENDDTGKDGLGNGAVHARP